MRIYNACHRTVGHHGSPPNSFLDQLIDGLDRLPAEVFAVNDREDIYSLMLPMLGPYTSLLHRKAVMAEVLRVQAGFESDWNWNEGVDRSNAYSCTHLIAQETGAWQVSMDSMSFDPSLERCYEEYFSSTVGSHSDSRFKNMIEFIELMKSDHHFAVEYVARLLRFSTRWAGTLNDPDQVRAWVRRDAVAEFMTFLTVPVVTPTVA